MLEVQYPIGLDTRKIQARSSFRCESWPQILAEIKIGLFLRERESAFRKTPPSFAGSSHFESELDDSIHEEFHFLLESDF